VSAIEKPDDIAWLPQAGERLNRGGHGFPKKRRDEIEEAKQLLSGIIKLSRDRRSEAG
jgi:hypothetical protein